MINASLQLAGFKKNYIRNYIVCDYVLDRGMFNNSFYGIKITVQLIFG